MRLMDAVLDPESVDSWNSAATAAALASLGYPGFRGLEAGDRKNPAVVLLAAVAANDLEVRIVEALPWLIVKYHDLDWEWLIREAKFRAVQNRLGFLVTLARQVAEKWGDNAAADCLCKIEAILDGARLVHEDTLCQASLSDAQRRWLRRTRPIEATHWNLVTDLNVQILAYAG